MGGRDSAIHCCSIPRAAVRRSLNTNDDKMVLGVVGSQHRPSRMEELSGLSTHVWPAGHPLVAAALNGQVGSLAGVLYDLKFAALTHGEPRMSADLNRCAEFSGSAPGAGLLRRGQSVRPWHDARTRRDQVDHGF